MIERKTTKEIIQDNVYDEDIVELLIRKEEIKMPDVVWLRADDVRKVLQNLHDEENNFCTEEFVYLLKEFGLCNSQEQKGITAQAEQKDYEKSPMSVSCEHNTGGDKPVNSLQQVKMQNRSSPVQNLEEDLRYKIKGFNKCSSCKHKHACLKTKKACKYFQGLDLRGRCGGVLDE